MCTVSKFKTHKNPKIKLFNKTSVKPKKLKTHRAAFKKPQCNPENNHNTA